MIQNVYVGSSATQKSTSSVDSLDYKYTASGSLTADQLAKNPKVFIKETTEGSVTTYEFYKILFVISGTAYLSDKFTPANGTMYKSVSDGSISVVSVTTTHSTTLI